jgi:hypothetical protein
MRKNMEDQENTGHSDSPCRVYEVEKKKENSSFSCAE